MSKPRCRKGASCGDSCISKTDSCKSNEPLPGFLNRLLNKFAEFLGLKNPNGVSPGDEDKDVPEDKKFALKTVGSGDPLVTQAKINKAFFDLEDADNAENLGKFRRLVNANGYKALIYNAKDQGKQPKKKMQKAYEDSGLDEKFDTPFKDLDKSLIAPPVKNMSGYTWDDADPQVMITNQNKKAFNPNGDAFRDAVKQSITEGGDFVMGDRVSDFGGDVESKLLGTFIHEMGHNIHNDQGKPIFGEFDDNPDDPKFGLSNGVSRYGTQDPDEFFAEHLTAWAIAPKELKETNEDIFNYIDNVVNDALEDFS